MYYYTYLTCLTFFVSVIPRGASTPAPRTGLSKENIIAIVVGVGGFLLIVIIAVALWILRKQKKGSKGTILQYLFDIRCKVLPGPSTVKYLLVT